MYPDRVRRAHSGGAPSATYASVGCQPNPMVLRREGEIVEHPPLRISRPAATDKGSLPVPKGKINESDRRMRMQNAMQSQDPLWALRNMRLSEGVASFPGSARRFFRQAGRWMVSTRQDRAVRIPGPVQCCGEYVDKSIVSQVFCDLRSRFWSSAGPFHRYTLPPIGHSQASCSIISHFHVNVYSNSRKGTISIRTPRQASTEDAFPRLPSPLFGLRNDPSRWKNR